MTHFTFILAGVWLAFIALPLSGQQPPPQSSAKAVAKYPALGKQGSPFNREFLRRLKIHAAENPQFMKDKTWPQKLADEVAEVMDTYAPESVIEFKVLLIIKRFSDSYHPLFLPVRAEMTKEDISKARHCFEIQTPDMVHDVTHGKVKFTPTVVVSDLPLRCFDPGRRDSAEYLGNELVQELATFSKPGEYDTVGYYFLHYDNASGYRIPRAGYGVGGYNGSAGIGMFAVSSAGSMNPRDEVFLHEWMHGLDGFYGGKEGVKLPKGALHGSGNYAAHYQEAKAWRPQDTFKGFMEWYRDDLNGEVPEGDGYVGLGLKAWRHGPMRKESGERGRKFSPTELPVGEYPEWVHELMKGNLANAQLTPCEIARVEKPGVISAGQTPWGLESWSNNPGTSARYSESDGGTFSLECGASNHASIRCETAVTPSTNYVFTGEVKSTQIKVEQTGGRDSVLLAAGDSHSTKDLSGSVDWTPIVLPFTTKPDQNSVTVRLQIGGRGSLASGKAIFRNVRLQRVGYPSTRLIRTSQQKTDTKLKSSLQPG